MNLSNAGFGIYEGEEPVLINKSRATKFYSKWINKTKRFVYPNYDRFGQVRNIHGEFTQFPPKQFPDSINPLKKKLK